MKTLIFSFLWNFITGIKLQGRGEKNNSRNIPIFFEDTGSLSIRLEMKWQMIMGFPILGVF